MSTCLIGLGTNLGNRREMLGRAIALLRCEPTVQLLSVSQWHETRPVGGPADQPAYLNGAATIETALTPRALLAVLQKIENRLGRSRRQRWGPRTIDLDLLLQGNHVERSSLLAVPHPHMAWRRFVLEPAAEIAGSMVHPVIGWDIARLLAHLNTAPFYVAVTGMVSPENTTFTHRVVDAHAADGLFEQYETTVSRSTIIGCRHPRPRFPADPSGNGLSGELECLRRRAHLLAANGPQWSRPKCCGVSDFWFGESRARGLGRLAAHEQPPFFRLWRRLEPRVVRPRLVVVLDVPARQLREQIRRHRCPRQRRLRMVALRRWQGVLDRELRRRDVGPVLRLVDPQSDESLEEVLAAIQAMA